MKILPVETVERRATLISEFTRHMIQLKPEDLAEVLRQYAADQLGFAITAPIEIEVNPIVDYRYEEFEHLLIIVDVPKCLSQR
jgi:hypothetical protein